MKTMITIVTILLTAGCVVFPTSHLVFEPISSEGKLINPEACGYMFGNKVLLVIQTPDYKLETMSFADSPERQLKVFFRIVPSNESITVDLNSLRTVLQNGGVKELKPTSISEHAYGRSINDVRSITGSVTLWQGTENFYYLEFPIMQKEVDQFDLIIGAEAIAAGDKKLTVRPIKFKKTKQSDIYYASINC